MKIHCFSLIFDENAWIFLISQCFREIWDFFGAAPLDMREHTHEVDQKTTATTARAGAKSKGGPGKDGMQTTAVYKSRPGCPGVFSAF